MLIPNSFKKHIGSYFTNGADWLERLPKLVDSIEEDWSIKLLDPFKNLSFNYVAPAQLENGELAVFKIGPSLNEVESEIEALKAWNGRGSVKLLKSDTTQGALLLEKLDPGVSFWASSDNGLASQTCANLLEQLWITKTPSFEFRSLESWSRELKTYHSNHSVTNSPLPWRLVDKAMVLRSSLLTTKAEVLLHGDLHHDNILSAHRQAYLAIDPKGVMGPRAYDTASFLVNPTGISQQTNFNQLLEQRLDIFSSQLKLSKEEIAAWGFVHCLLSVTWSLQYTKFPQEPIRIARALENHFS